MKRLTLGVSLLTLAAMQGELQAQCLKVADQAAFETQISRNLVRSDWTYTQIYLHALNRFGYGSQPGRANALDTQRADRWNHLAGLIAGNLKRSDRIDTATDDTLATLRRTAPKAHQNPRPYRFANRTLNQTYAGYKRLRDIERDLRDRFADDPSLAEELALASKARASTNGDLRNTARVRRVAHLLGSTNIDLGEVLGEFWLNHFNIDARKTPWASIDYQKALRTQQCSTFLDLLLSSAQHPAMLVYLDSFRSRIGNINENCGRELLELHTVIAQLG